MASRVRKFGEIPAPNHTGSSRRSFLEAGTKTGAAILLPLLPFLSSPPCAQAAGLPISDLYSPWNRKRPRRPATRFIVLHTTEGEEKGSLSKIVNFGEAHYFVGRSGQVFRIIDRSRIATHAGRSMWEGNRNIDDYSLGIEISGYHDQDITPAQYESLAELLRQLKNLYRIPDENVLTHSMVAYGRPNRFHHSNHRGRKRCGMIFADRDVRARLGLNGRPVRDPDVESGRLKVGDPDLYAFLFTKAPRAAAALVAGLAPTPAHGVAVPTESNVIDEQWTAWRIARERYNSSETTYVFPNGNRLRGDEIRDWSQIPKGTHVLLAEADELQGFEGFYEIGKDGDTPKELAGEDYDTATSIYFFPDGLIRTGRELRRRRSMRSLLHRPPPGTRILTGYVYGGYVKSRRPPSFIAGIKWNYPSTYYRYPDGSIVGGDQIDDSAIPVGTLVFYRQ